MHFLALIDILARALGIAVGHLNGNDVSGFSTKLNFFSPFLRKSCLEHPITWGWTSFQIPSAILEALLDSVALQAVSSKYPLRSQAGIPFHFPPSDPMIPGVAHLSRTCWPL